MCYTKIDSRDQAFPMKTISFSYPSIQYYDNDFIDAYVRTWSWLEEHCQRLQLPDGKTFSKLFVQSDTGCINQYETIWSVFFLVYSNNTFPAHNQLDVFYSSQEESGAIRADYSLKDGSPQVMHADNPEAVNPPLFSWAEYNVYQRMGNKRRIQDVLPILMKYYQWLETTFQQKNGLYQVPLSATMFPVPSREKARYFVDFNTQQAINAYYIAELGNIINDKSITFRYKQRYFALKTRINTMMWNSSLDVYCDLDKDEEQLSVKTLASFWPILVNIPDTRKLECLVRQLQNPKTFGTPHPFPSLACDEPDFSGEGMGYRGSVFSPLVFMIVKGLQSYGLYEFAQEISVKHLYTVVYHPDKSLELWEAYRPLEPGPAQWEGNEKFPRKHFLPFGALSTIALFIEGVLGFDINIPRKTVRWTISDFELMGIEGLALKRNTITILCRKEARGWEIFHESKKLYYFTLDIGSNSRTLPIPSGRCSMLIDKQ